MKNSSFLSIAGLWLFFSASCSGGLKDVDTKDSKAADAKAIQDQDEVSEGSDEPAYINGASLTLGCESDEQNQDQGIYTFSCHILTQEGKKISPTKFAANYSWSVKGVADIGNNIEVTESVNNENNYSAKIRVGKSSYVTPDQLRRMTVSFGFKDKKSNETVELQTRLDSIFGRVSSQKYFRLVIKSIKDHDPATTVEFVNKIEVKLNGSWKELSIDAATGFLKIDGGLVESNGYLDDSVLFANIIGQLDPPRRASDFERFNNFAPKFIADEPLILTFGTGIPQSVTGLRYNGGLPLVGKNIAAGFPDVFFMEASTDKTNWSLIPGSSFDIDKVEDAAILQYLWTGN